MRHAGGHALQRQENAIRRGVGWGGWGGGGRRVAPGSYGTAPKSSPSTVTSTAVPPRAGSPPSQTCRHALHHREPGPGDRPGCDECFAATSAVLERAFSRLGQKAAMRMVLRR